MSKPRARIKEVPEDFVVEEIPAYAPSGAGEHLYVRFTKRDMTTDQAVRALCAAVSAEPRGAGVAGMKDKRAVTTQTVSLHTAANPTQIDVPGITVHEISRHGNKLKPGHLAGNKFTIVVRGIERGRVEDVVAALGRAKEEGVPNAFGAQRFGARGDNVARALAWLTGKERPPRDPRQRRFLFSALQSEIFNEVLAARVRAGTWALPLAGDVVKLRVNGGLFLCTDVQADKDRALRGEVSPTGPIAGVKMRAPEGEPLRIEAEATERILGPGFDFAAHRALGEGTRRALRLWVEDLQITALSESSAASDATEEQGASVRVYFVLPKGAYATTVLATAVDLSSDGSLPSELHDPGTSE